MHTQYSHMHTHTTHTHTTHTHMLQAVTGNLVLRNFTKNITPPIPNNQPHSHVHSKHFVRILASLPLCAVLDGCKEQSVGGGGGEERGAGNVKERNTLACVISFGSSHVASKHRRTHTHAHTTFNQLHFGAQCNANDCRHCDCANNAIT